MTQASAGMTHGLTADRPRAAARRIHWGLLVAGVVAGLGLAHLVMLATQPVEPAAVVPLAPLFCTILRVQHVQIAIRGEQV